MNNNCKNCGRDLVLKVLEAGVSRVCPVCGPVYSIAKNVSGSNAFSPQTRNAAALLCVGLLGFVAINYSDAIAKFLKKNW
jgi:hypothetical protein